MSEEEKLNLILEKTDKTGRKFYYNNYYITQNEIIVFFRNQQYKFKIKQNIK